MKSFLLNEIRIKLRVWVLLLVLIIGLLIIGILRLDKENEILIPDVKGLHLEMAVKTIQTAGFQMPEIIESPSGIDNVNIVVDQQPHSGVKANKNAEIKITVGK